MTDLVKQNVAPSYISKDDVRGLDDLKTIIVPSRLKVIQPQTQDDELSAMFNLGDVVLIPEKELLLPVDSDEYVEFIPILFYREWCTWNPLKMQGTLPFIRERSIDPEGEIAKKAMNEGARQEPCPENPKEMLRHMAHLNFLVLLRREGGPQLPVQMGFVSAEFKTGRRFANLIIARNAPIYSSIYKFKTSERSNVSGKWYGLDIMNADEPWVNETEYGIFRQLHLDLTEKAKMDGIKADYEDTSNKEKGEYSEFTDNTDNL